MSPRRPHALIVTIPEKGHINPLIGVARALDRQGAEVSICAPADITAQLRAADLDLPCHVLSNPDFCPPEEHATRGEAFATRSQDPAWMRRWIERLLLETAPGMIAPLRALIARVRPDVVVTDPMVYAAPIAAEAEGVPWAGLSSSLNPVTPRDWTCPLVDTARALSPAREALFAPCGPAPRFEVCDAISPWLNTVFTTEAYAPRALSGNDFSFYVGPSRPGGPRGDEAPFPWERLDPGLPLVYMSLGSQNFHHPRLFCAVADALAGRGVQLVMAVSDLIDADLPLPPEVIAVRYAPQLALLERASLVINHGGANSVMETLACGLPLLQLPLVNDQPLQARFLTLSGAGVALDPATLTPEGCSPHLLAMLADDAPERLRAQAIGRSFAGRDGAAEAAALILELARDRAPMRPVIP